MTKLYIERSIGIKAPASRVWTILTNPEFTSRWSGVFGATGPIDAHWKVGGRVLWRNAEGQVYVSGTVVAVKENQLLRFTVRAARPEMQPISGREEDDITQTYALSEHDGVTTLSTSHGDFSKLANGEQIQPGAAAVWDQLLPKIKELAES